MKVKSLTTFKSKLLKPCKKFLRLFKFKKPISIRPLSSLRRQHNTPRLNWKKAMRGMLMPLCSKKIDVEDIGELRSMDGRRTERLLFPSPITPAYLKAGVVKAEVKGQEVDGACRSFENYLVDMVVEDGKLRDLMDVEELLYCWKNLKCPVFRNLVCRFYGELCKDLFSGQEED